ncbi:hypothetical protein H6G96_12730 [Nostoc sp. FACHB-892]|uniref:hypothetical protein n=1 Tax=Nostoc sp. FACHB-892 TaxID=2692843 RepID=UPI001996F2E0|nr:hypothetical protein [Nostoc sp. FACHB-892]MBD2727171.1 hypothetical protein [Nostoc sp. FACHB-892]
MSTRNLSKSRFGLNFCLSPVIPILCETAPNFLGFSFVFVFLYETLPECAQSCGKPFRVYAVRPSYSLTHLYTELVLKLKVLTQYVLEIGWYPAIARDPPELMN